MPILTARVLAAFATAFGGAPATVARARPAAST
jgi:hypothetical protein